MASSIETHADRAQIDAAIMAGVPLRTIVARWNISMGAVQRRKKALTKAAAASAPARPSPLPGSTPPSPHTAPIPPAMPAPAEILQPVAPDPEIAPAVEAPDADEAGNNDAHLARLRLVNLMLARGWRHREIAAHFGRSVRTIERWVAQARNDKRASIAKLDLHHEVGDVLWFSQFARSQHLVNAERALANGDLSAHRRAIEAAARADVARVNTITELVRLGIVSPSVYQIEQGEERVRNTIGATLKRLLTPIYAEIAAAHGLPAPAVPTQPTEGVPDVEAE